MVLLLFALPTSDRVATRTLLHLLHDFFVRVLIEESYFILAFDLCARQHDLLSIEQQCRHRGKILLEIIVLVRRIICLFGEDFVAFSVKSPEGFAILDGGATKTVSGFMSVQPVADRYEDITIETTDVGFTFAGGQTEAANTKICVPHADFLPGISVNVVSNESTPFLIVWMCYESMGWSSTTTTIVCTVTF